MAQGFINASFSSAAGGDVAAIAGVTGVNIKIWRVNLTNGVATAQALIFKDGATALTGAMALTTAVGGAINLGDGINPIWILGSGNAFNVNESAATSVTGFIQYTLG